MAEKTKVNSSEILGGIAASLVALPSAIAFGLIIYSSLGAGISSKGVIAGIIGIVVLGIIAAFLTGTPGLISTPCAAAAAVLGVFAEEMLSSGIDASFIPIYIILVSAGAGIVQFLFGLLRGGDFIKYIPYPVVAGYLGGVGSLIILGQLPKFFGVRPARGIFNLVKALPEFQLESVLIGSVSMLVMVVAPRFIKKFPVPILALGFGVGTYLGLATQRPELMILEKNPFLIGPINASLPDIGKSMLENFGSIGNIEWKILSGLTVPILTLAVLLSIDTLKTCVLLDVLSGTRHNSNKELIAQGLGNFFASVCGGVPGAGATGPSLVNFYSGGRTQISSLVSGFTSLLILLLFTPFIAWIPISSLAGVLIVIGYRMVDVKNVKLLTHRATRFDFVVILAVIVSAISLSLISAAGVGIALAITLFLREQIRFSVIRQLSLGSKISSKKTRTSSERKILAQKGNVCVAIELQGQLFFGTTDQLYREVEPYLKQCKYFIFDMRRVLSIDFTASNMLVQIQKKIQEVKGILIFSNVPLSVPTGKNLLKYLGNFGFTVESGGVEVFAELSDAIEWVEDTILQEENRHRESKNFDLDRFEFFEGANIKALRTLLSEVEEKEYYKGDKIFSIGDLGGEIYFIKHGDIRIEIPLSNGNMAHRATFCSGGFFGDLSFLDNQKRSADAVVSSDTALLYVLSRKNFDEITRKYPEVSSIFYEKLAYQLSNRLRSNVIELTSLQE
jgi:sulfate permease, SulP family